MEPTSMMRVNAHSSSYGGHGSTPQDRQHQRRQKKLALIDAVEHGHLEASKHALKVLMNFDQSLSTDAQFVRLSKALDAGSVYLAQQIVREIKAKLINATPLATYATQAAHAAHTVQRVLALQAACMSRSRIKPHCPLPPPVSARHMACKSLSRIKPHWPLPPPVVARQ